MATQKPRFVDVAQRHHDYYVWLKREGRLPEEKQVQYDLAMQREREGKVKRMPANYFPEADK
jgi:hypothetical protein